MTSNIAALHLWKEKELENESLSRLKKILRDSNYTVTKTWKREKIIKFICAHQEHLLSGKKLPTELEESKVRKERTLKNAAKKSAQKKHDYTIKKKLMERDSSEEVVALKAKIQELQDALKRNGASKKRGKEPESDEDTEAIEEPESDEDTEAVEEYESDEEHQNDEEPERDDEPESDEEHESKPDSDVEEPLIDRRSPKKNQSPKIHKPAVEKHRSLFKIKKAEVASPNQCYCSRMEDLEVCIIRDAISLTNDHSIHFRATIKQLYREVKGGNVTPKSVGHLASRLGIDPHDLKGGKGNINTPEVDLLLELFTIITDGNSSRHLISSCLIGWAKARRAEEAASRKRANAVPEPVTVSKKKKN